MHDLSKQDTRAEIVRCGDGSRYHMLDLVGATAGSPLYRARRIQEDEGGAEGALLKLLDAEHMQPERAAALRAEYTLLRTLDVAGVARARALVVEPQRMVMVLDDVPGELLEAVLAREQFAWPAVLRLGLQLARILAGLHAAQLVQRDVRPVNLMLGPQQTLCLVDLSRATRGAAPAGGAVVPDWAYVSPEQTGRVERAVDQRSDLYSLGVTLYRMLAGQLPFHGNDALEWAHCHIARLARPPAEVRPGIAPALSAIVMKLLEKMPEERYQSAHGLLCDLEHCLALAQAGVLPAPFPLATRDRLQRMRIVPALFGRDSELAHLLARAAGMTAAARPGLLLVHGEAGVGKSALMHALRRHKAGPGYAISGKFDQFQRDNPHAPVLQALGELVRQILAESAARIDAWRARLRAALGANGQVMVAVLPQLELIIGAQPALPPLPPAEAQNRFRLVFQAFIDVFAQAAHPLTLFLDDLQWADRASLALIGELLGAGGPRALLVLGAYRANEVDLGHPLTAFLDELGKKPVAVAQLALAPLAAPDLRPFIDAMLQCEGCATPALARLVHGKTGGNPFFVIQFMLALADEGLIGFDSGARAWRWDLARIGAKGYTDNVAELMVGQLGRLPAPALAALQRLACLPSGPQDAALATAGQPPAEAQSALAAAIEAGLIGRTEAGIHFLHDRVQEAVYLSIPAHARPALHLQLARLLTLGKTRAEVEDAVFTVVGQFNRGAERITDGAELALLYELNFLAGKKAKAAVAYAAACAFLNRARALLPADAWQQRYRQMFALTLALSEAEYLAGHFQRADQLAEQLLVHAHTRRDCACVHQLRMQLYQMAGRYDDALHVLFEAARLFDLHFPTDPQAIEAAIEAEVSDIARAVAGRPIAALADARALQDADLGILIALLAEAIAPAYSTRPAYFALITAQAVRLSLRHGHTEDSCLAYSVYGIVLLARRGDIGSACAFSDMALRLNERLGGRRLKGRLLAVQAATYSPWQDFIGNAAPVLERALAACLEVGDLVYANYIAFCSFWPLLQQGAPLDALLQTVRRHAAFARETGNDLVYQAIRLQQQLVHQLKGLTRAADSPDDAPFDEAQCFAAMEKARFGAGMYTTYILRQVAAFLGGDYAGALAAARQAQRKSRNSGSIMVVDWAHHFYFALTLAALHGQAPPQLQGEYAALLARERERHKSWAEYCPRNFRGCLALLDAEFARIEGRADDAEQLYERAILAAREDGFVQNEAIGFELAAGFYRARGLDLIADTYLVQARDAYLRWGAEGKVGQLDSLYPSLCERTVALPFDVLSVAKAAQAISGPVVMHELADTLLHIVLENAGAQSGALLLCDGTELHVAAEAGADAGLRGPHTAHALPAAILNYVRHSRSALLLSDVAQPHPYSDDPFFAAHQPKSLLCLPILQRDCLIGLLYLENNLVTRAFAPERVAVLKLLASQAAISLENARLFAELQQENNERKRAEVALQEREARIRRLVDANIIGVFFGDVGGGISDANDAFLALSGYTRQDLRAGALRWSALTPAEYRAADQQALAELARTGISAAYEKEFIRRDGGRAPVLVGSALIEGTQDQLVSFVLDLRARKQAEEQVRHLADHDALTGLPNRALLQDRLNQAIAHAHRDRSQVAVLFIDLDYFKHINDSLGHHIGDRLLQMAAARLQTCLREDDSVARLGGDEFVLTLPHLSGLYDAALVAKKALAALDEAFLIDGNELHVSGSIGISLYPDDGADVDSLMRAADTAMYHAKESGRGNFQFFTPALNRAAQQRLDIEKRLRHALAHDEFVLHYQPQVDMASGRIFSIEALLRWQPAGAQAVSCGAFIASAEQSGLIVPIGDWALRQACRQLKVWREAGHRHLKMAVNLSPRQLQQADFCARVRQIVDEAGLPAGALELEITESILMQHSEGNLATLTRLTQMGIQLSLDDFGTGYSSLAYLQRFPVHALKIDQSFVRDIGSDPNDAALVTAIIAMAASLHMQVMAEGVENWQQAQFLIAHDCAAAQGFYYSPALPADALGALLAADLPLRGAHR